jgi:hypothetical protein
MNVVNRLARTVCTSRSCSARGPTGAVGGGCGPRHRIRAGLVAVVLDAERVGQQVDGRPARRLHPAQLQVADGADAEAGPLGQFLLRPAAFLAQRRDPRRIPGVAADAQHRRHRYPLD